MRLPRLTRVRMHAQKIRRVRLRVQKIRGERMHALLIMDWFIYLFIWGFTSLSTLYRSYHDG